LTFCLEQINYNIQRQTLNITTFFQPSLFFDFVPTNKGAALLEYYYNTLSDAMMSTTPAGADGQPRAIGFGFEPLKEAFNICKVLAILPLLLHPCAFLADLDPMVMQQLKKGAYEEKFEKAKKITMDTAENALKEAMEILANMK
jgi:hypothetical protein